MALEHLIGLSRVREVDDGDLLGARGLEAIALPGDLTHALGATLNGSLDLELLVIFSELTVFARHLGDIVASLGDAVLRLDVREQERDGHSDEPDEECDGSEISCQ